jgi:hypothetical protein
MKREHLEIAQLNREVAKQKGDRDILKKLQRAGGNNAPRGRAALNTREHIRSLPHQARDCIRSEPSAFELQAS